MSFFQSLMFSVCSDKKEKGVYKRHKLHLLHSAANMFLSAVSSLKLSIFTRSQLLPDRRQAARASSQDLMLEL